MSEPTEAEIAALKALQAELMDCSSQLDRAEYRRDEAEVSIAKALKDKKRNDKKMAVLRVELEKQKKYIPKLESKIAWKYEDLAATKRSVVAQEEIEKDYLRKYNKYRARTALSEEEYKDADEKLNQAEIKVYLLEEKIVEESAEVERAKTRVCVDKIAAGLAIAV